MAIIDMKGFLYYSEIIDLTNPDKYRKKYTFQQKIAVQRKRLDELKAQLDKLNVDIGNLNQSNSDQLKVVFDKYELAFKQYNLALEEMENLVYQAKYAWMTENTEDLSLQKDFHVKRAIIGAKFELKNIFFELGSAVLKEDSKKELDKLVEIMKYSEIVIELGGHTDSIGTSEANQKLSQDRVESVKKYLTDKGISQNRMVAVGYGETLPVASNSTPEGRQLNRRVEVKILKLQADKEGTDVVTEEDKKKKDKKEVAPVAKKGEMLPILQAAARKGGLPSGSDCNSEVYVPKYTNTNYKGTNTKNNNNKYGKGSYFDKDRLSIKENIYKQFNLSLMNHRYKSMGMSTGASMILLNKKKLNEHHLEYYFGNPNNVKWGAGYTGLKMWQLKEKTGLPMNIFAGLDLKYFENDGGASQKEDDNFYHLNVPVGARLIFPVKQIIFAPEFQYSFMLARNKKEPFGEPFMDNTSFMKFGAMARWKFLHAGLHVNLGKEISFLGYRLGVSF